MASPPQPPSKVVPRALAVGVSIATSISKSKTGPGLILLVDDVSEGPKIENGVPSPMQKWAEEGYCVVEILTSAVQPGTNVLTMAVDALIAEEACLADSGLGIVAYSYTPWAAMASAVSTESRIIASIIYVDQSDTSAISSEYTVPTLVHVAGKLPQALPPMSLKRAYEYQAQSSPLFATPFTKAFNYATEAISHTRNLTHLKPLMKGPYFDLESIWDEHTYYEFEVRDVEATMATMVQEPYVNHIPTLTGGIGREALTAFYRDHFVFSNPKDTKLELISRTTGIDRIVDEFLFKFTHDVVVDWLFPCIPPTHKYVEIPFIAIVNIRGDRLYHEHISWDQATALRQIGYLPDRLPAPAVEGVVNGGQADGGSVTGAPFNGRPKGVKLPVAGLEAAAKLRDKNAVPSNLMFNNDKA